MSEEVVSADSQPTPAPEVPVAPDERRREYRLNRVLGAELRHGEELVKARLYVINISRTGMKATNHFALTVDDVQEFGLYLAPKEAPLELKAKIAWQRELTLSGMFEIGFEFVDVSAADSQRLESFIEAERKKAEPPKNLDLTSIWKFGKVD